MLIAPLGAAVKVELTDGTTQVRVGHSSFCAYLEEFLVNRKMKVRDQVGTAGAQDLKRVMRAQAESGQPTFGRTVDVAEAHRIIQVHEGDWPFLACQVRCRIFLNLVGAFWCRQRRLLVGPPCGFHR